MYLRDEDFLQSLRKETEGLLEESGEDFAYARHVALAPDLFHLLCGVSMDPEVPGLVKGGLVGAVVYFISPLDLIPEGVQGASGFIDDVAVAAHALNRVAEATSPDVLKRHWTGKGDVMEAITAILTDAEDMLGRGRWKNLKKTVFT